MKALPKGMFTALITPFNEDESINFDALRGLIDFQVESGIHGLLIGGSTGEYHTMSMEERKAVIQAACEHAAGRIPIMAGHWLLPPLRHDRAGQVFRRLRRKMGAGHCTLLSPYHPPGREDYFKEVAAGCEVGLCLYNYPSGVGFELEPEMIAELAQEPNIVALKDTADMEHTAETLAATRGMDFAVLQGFEHLMLPCFALGGAGAFGIVHNLVPREMVELYETFMAGNWKRANELNARLTNLYQYMELEPFPGPVKVALGQMGYFGGVLRKPLTMPSQELSDKVTAELKKLGAIS